MMPSQRSPKSSTILPPRYESAEVAEHVDITTPKQLLQFVAIGTGKNFDVGALKTFAKSAPNALEVARQARSEIERLTGIPISKMCEVAQETAFKRTGKAEKTRRRIRTAMTDNLSFLQRFKKNNRAGELSKLCRAAEDFLKYIREKHLANDGESLPNNEVMVCNDAAELMLIVFNDLALEKTKLEAAIKLVVAYNLGLAEDQNEAHEDQDKALNFMMDILNERIHKLPEGAKIGQVFRRYMVSKHAPETYKTIEAGIVKERIEEADSSIRVTPLISRRTIVSDKKGEERIIFFYEVPREKTTFSSLTKDFRYNETGKGAKDKNGFRFVFDNIRDFEDFMKMFKKEIKMQIQEGLMERLEDVTDPSQISVIKSRLINLDASVIISNEKGDLEKPGFKASSESGSSELQVLKFTITITLADGRIYSYEFQVFIPVGFADYLYRKGVSWEEYSQKRFWDKGIDQDLFPERIYPELNREKIITKMMKIAHQKAWNANGENKPTNVASNTEKGTKVIEEQAPKTINQQQLCSQPSAIYCKGVE